MNLFQDDRKRNSRPSFEHLLDARSSSLVGQQSLKGSVPHHHFETMFTRIGSNVTKASDDTIFKESMTPNKGRKIEMNQQTEENGKI